jgi:hypothetical protein
MSQVLTLKTTHFPPRNSHLKLWVGTRQGKEPSWNSPLGIPDRPKDSHLLHSWIVTPVSSHGCPTRQERNRSESPRDRSGLVQRLILRNEGYLVSVSSCYGSRPTHPLNLPSQEEPSCRLSTAPHLEGRSHSYFSPLPRSAMAGLGTSPATSSSTWRHRWSSSSMESGSETFLFPQGSFGLELPATLQFCRKQLLRS